MSQLLQQSADGAFNFSRDLIDPTTGQPVSSFYRSTETWDTKFAGFSSAYEECRAEAVGVYLCLEKDVLEMFGATTEADQADLVYVNWLSMARAGLMGLEYYTPETATWRQAHMQARYVILRVMMEAGQGLVTIEKCKGAKGGDSCLVRLDRSKVWPLFFQTDNRRIDGPKLDRVGRATCRRQVFADAPGAQVDR